MSGGSREEAAARQKQESRRWKEKNEGQKKARTVKEKPTSEALTVAFTMRPEQVALCCCAEDSPSKPQVANEIQEDAKQVGANEIPSNSAHEIHNSAGEIPSSAGEICNSAGEIRNSAGAHEICNSAGEIPNSAAHEIPNSAGEIRNSAAHEIPNSAAHEIPNSAGDISDSAAHEIPNSAGEIPNSAGAHEIRNSACEIPNSAGAHEIPEIGNSAHEIPHSASHQICNSDKIPVNVKEAPDAEAARRAALAKCKAALRTKNVDKARNNLRRILEDPSLQDCRSPAMDDAFRWQEFKQLKLSSMVS